MAWRHPSASIRVLFVCDTAATDVFFPLVSRRRKKNSAGFVFFRRFGALNKVKKNAAAAAALDISNPFFSLTRHQHRRRVRRLSVSLSPCLSRGRPIGRHAQSSQEGNNVDFEWTRETAAARRVNLNLLLVLPPDRS